MSTARQETILIGCVSDQDRSTVRGRITILTSNRLDLIRPDVLRLSRLRYGDTIFRVVAATETYCSDTFYKRREKDCDLIK